MKRAGEPGSRGGDGEPSGPGRPGRVEPQRSPPPARNSSPTVSDPNSFFDLDTYAAL